MPRIHPTISNRRSKYPAIEPFESGFLPVTGGHKLYYEQSGNPHGKPVLFVHGGPGGGTDGGHRQYFDPEHYRIILFDQRGAGKSLPHAGLENNTTWDLVADIEALREKLQIKDWLVFGGSWGSTLGLAYSETHPDRVSGLILRGIFLCRREEIHWFYQFGAHHLFPDLWEQYIAVIPETERHDLLAAYFRRLTSEHTPTRMQAAKAWSAWEGGALKLFFDKSTLENMTTDMHAEALARIECHYFMNHAFFKADNWLIQNADKIKHIPTIIVHGRYDVVCPVKSAWDLHKALPKSELHIIPDSGHAASEPGIVDALVKATDAFRV